MCAILFFSRMLTRTPLSSKHGHYITSFLRQSVSRCSFTAVWQEAHVFPESTACSLIVQPGTFKGKLSFSLFSARFRITYVYVEYS